MSHHHNPHSFESALQELKDGNARFLAGRSKHPHQDLLLRDRLDREGQTPLAAVLACSDSRAPVELIFDQGFGDLFIVRAAGQVAGPDQIGSLEYAVEHLEVPLILVLGHTHCGAVTAAVNGAREEGALGELLARLDPVVKMVEHLPLEERAEAAVEKNVSFILQELTAKSRTLARAEGEKRVRLAGAVDMLQSGEVKFLDF